MTDLPRSAGQALAVPLGALARRRSGKPMHPRGVVAHGVLQRHGDAGPGVRWLDEAGTDPVLVRLSRGAGLPGLLPDLLGLAVRLTAAGETVDLLMSSTGRGRLTRFLPVPRRSAACAYSSIMGYRTDAGTVWLAAHPEQSQAPSDPEPLAGELGERGLAFDLVVAARALGPWRPFARLAVTGPDERLDPDVRFDAVRNPPPGLVADGPMARFRSPAYAAARAGREERRAGI